MGHVDVNAVSYSLPDGRPLLCEVSLRVGEGAKVALIGPNGTGKTSLLRIVSGDLDAHDGAITRSGGLGVMRQFIGKVRDDTSVRDLLVSVAPEPIRRAAAAVDAAELAMMERDDEPAQMAYAQALADWGDAGGYEHETLWDVCTVAALGIAFEQAQWRACARSPVVSRSGWSWRRCCAAPRTCCCWTSRTTTSTCRPSAGSRRR